MALKKKIVYLLVLLLVLQVVKAVSMGINFSWSFFASTVLVAIQVLLFLAFLYDLLFGKIFRKRWMRIGSFVVVVAICELLFAWLLYHPVSIPSFLKKTVDHYYAHYDVDIIQFNKQFSVYHPQLFYTLRPGATGKFRNVEFNTTIDVNRLGLRDDDGSLQGPSIICVGDSHTMGWGVEQGQSFPQLLEQLSGRKVLNAGISSYGTARELILLQQLDTSNLRHIVLQYYANDLDENKSFVAHHYKLPVSSQAVYDSIVKQNQFTRLYFPGKYFLVITKIYLNRQYDHMKAFFKSTPGKHLDVREHARLFLDLLQHSGINFNKVNVTVFIPGDAAPFNREFLQHLRNLSAQSSYIDHFQNRLAIVDLEGILETNDYFPLDQHMKVAGHKKVAEKIWETIREK